MKKIYLIDNDFVRHEQLAPLIKNLNSPDGTSPEYVGNAPNNIEHAKELALQSISAENVWNAVTSAHPNSIFLIDLVLDDMEDGIDEKTSRPVLEGRIRAETAEWGTKARELLQTVSDEYKTTLSTYSTAVLACAVLKARGIKSILVSAAAAHNTFVQWREDWDIPIAQSRARDQWLSWRDEIVKLDRHPDDRTRQILDQFQESIASSNEAWEHDWCGRNVQCGKSLWSCEQIDDPSNKALHCRSNDAWALKSTPSRPIDVAVLQTVLNKLDFVFPVQINCTSPFVLPIEPGIVFLLSLRELIVAMSLGRPSPKAMVFGKDNGLHYVSVIMEGAAPKDSIKRLLTKEPKLHHTFPEHEKTNMSIRESIPAGGLSEAIFHLCHSRLGSIRGDEDWVNLFRNGSAQWVAWPCFTNEGITFYW